MAELPVIGPSAPSLSPAPVSGAQPLAANRLAQAGEQGAHDATQLFWMNNMARRDEQNALMDKKMGDLIGAHHAIMATALDRGLSGDQLTSFYQTEMNATSQQLLQDVPEGASRDLLAGAMHKQVAESYGQVLQTGVATRIKKAENDTVANLKDWSKQIPYLSPTDQAKFTTAGHNSIDQMGMWDKDQKQNFHNYFNGQIALHSVNKLVDEAPGHAMSMLMSPDWLKNNPDIVHAGDPAILRQQFINRAESSIKNGNAQMNLAFQQQQQNDWNKLVQMKGSGQPISSATLDSMPALPTRMKQLFKPDYHPQPVGDAGAFSAYLDRAKQVTTPVEGMLLQGEAIGSRSLNPQQMQEFNKQVAASVKGTSDVTENLKKTTLTDIENHFNPPHKPGFADQYNTKLKLGAELATRAQQEYTRSVAGVTDQAQVEKIHQQVIDKYDKIRQEFTAPKPASAAPPVAVPTPAPGVDVTRAMADAIRKSGALGAP